MIVAAAAGAGGKAQGAERCRGREHTMRWSRYFLAEVALRRGRLAASWHNLAQRQGGRRRRRSATARGDCNRALPLNRQLQRATHGGRVRWLGSESRAKVTLPSAGRAEMVRIQPPRSSRAGSSTVVAFYPTSAPRTVRGLLARRARRARGRG
jgi:hypothetical protein